MAGVVLVLTSVSRASLLTSVVSVLFTHWATGGQGSAEHGSVFFWQSWPSGQSKASQAEIPANYLEFSFKNLTITGNWETWNFWLFYGKTSRNVQARRSEALNNLSITSTTFWTSGVFANVEIISIGCLVNTLSNVFTVIQSCAFDPYWKTGTGGTFSYFTDWNYLNNYISK